MSGKNFSPLSLARRMGIASPAGTPDSAASSQASGADMPDSSDIVLSGYLTKLNSKKPSRSPVKILNLTVTGQKKYFVLTKNSLAYKATEADPSFKEVYGGIVAVEQGPAPTSLLVTVKPGEVVALTASSPEEAASWLAALKQVFAPAATLATDAIADKSAEPMAAAAAAPSVEEPTMHESQLGDETTTMTEVAVDEPLAASVPPAESKAPPSWLFSVCCGAE